ncbi:MAG: HAD family hydrolase [Endomicrobiales bacterium]|nr:HAD family hydrolase [Endomicrobiales bacterium]
MKKRYYKYKLLIFDLDGTLVDSLRDISRSVNCVRKSHGLRPLSAGVVRSSIGDGAKVLIKRSFPGLKTNRLTSALKAFRKDYRKRILDTTRFYPGIRGLLTGTPGLAKAVLTNKPADMAEKILRGLKARKFFKIVTGGDSGPNKKPDPEPVLEILRKLKVSKQDALMIGDSANDILCARAAGIKSMAVTYGFSKRAELAKHGPDMTVNTAKKIFNHV